MFVNGWKEEVDKQRLQQVYVWKGFIFFLISSQWSFKKADFEMGWDSSAVLFFNI